MKKQQHKLKLGVNVDHVATLRQARGTPYPSPLEAARACEQAGASGITVHLREDRRHIQDADVWQMRTHLKTRLNLEMANSPEIVKIALKVRPDEVCIVPERRKELTTEGGLDVVRNRRALADTVSKMTKAGIVVSLFVSADPDQLCAAAEIGTPYVELHTGTFCDASGTDAREELDYLIHGAAQAHRLGLRVNAGHGINLKNIGSILKLPYLDTLNIGHSIIARAVLVGMKQAVCEMLAAMRPYRRGHGTGVG